jgi:hypothetical protein
MPTGTRESGPQVPVSAAGMPGSSGPAAWETGPPRRGAWRTGPQAPVAATGSQRALPGRTGPQDAVRSTGSWRSVPVPEVAPWEPAQQHEPAYDQYPEQPEYVEYRDLPGDYPDQQAEPGYPEPGYPDPGYPEQHAPDRQAWPERHSHRAGRHGRPSRWRGPGGRSAGDGAS